MSAYANQIITTMEYLMDEIGKRLDNNKEVLNLQTQLGALPRN